MKTRMAEEEPVVDYSTVRGLYQVIEVLAARILSSHSLQQREGLRGYCQAQPDAPGLRPFWFSPRIRSATAMLASCGAAGAERELLVSRATCGLRQTRQFPARERNQFSERTRTDCSKVLAVQPEIPSLAEAAAGPNGRVIMSHDERACGIVYRPGGKSRVAPGPVNPALLHAISIVVCCCFGEMSLGVSRAILHQAIAIVKDQISVDFDITSIKLVGLQVDFSNQKIKSRCEEATGGFSASLNPLTALKMQN